MHYGSIMTTITLKNVPAAIHKKLKDQAKQHGRSLNREIITTLEAVLRGPDVDVEVIERNARIMRESMGVYLTQRDLTEIKNAGRK